jgi:PAS domain S-box-containing protein
VSFFVSKLPEIPRKLSIVALCIIALHFLEVFTLKQSPLGAALGNLLQISASFVGAAMCWRAARKGNTFANSFWVMVAIGVGTWGVSNFGWLYFETFLHREPPELSFVRFLFDTQEAFFAMALLLDRDDDSPKIDLGFLLDALQIALVFLFIFAGLFYIPSLTLDAQSALVREYVVAMVEIGALLVLALIRMVLTPAREARGLYRGLAVYLAVYGLGTAISNGLFWQHETPTGTLLDLAWTIPLLWAGFWAAGWKPDTSPGAARPVRFKTLGETILTNALFGIAPVLIFLLSAQLGPEWAGLRYSLLAVSVICYVARMAISDNRQARNAEIVRKQSVALDSAVDGTAIVSADGKYTYINVGFANIFGTMDREKMIGARWEEVSIKTIPALILEEMRASLAKEGRWYGVITVPHEQGRTSTVDVSLTALPEGGFIVLSRDLTDRRVAELARAEAEMKYRMIVEQVAAISYIAEPGVTGRWFYVSPQIESMLGYGQDEWIAGSSENWLQFIHPEDHAAVIEAEQSAIAGKSYQAEYRVKRKDGRTVWLSDTASVVQGSHDHPVMEGILVDISERKLMEMQSQQARRMEAVGRLAGGVAHDFNNLLTIIKGYTELAKQHSEGHPQIHNDIDRIEDASERAEALVRQLLAFSRKQVLQPKNLDLNSVIKGLETLLRRLLTEDIELQVKLNNSIGTIKADPAQIEQVLMNLVVNARDAITDGGRIIIETSAVDLDQDYADEHISVKSGHYVLLAVSDTGVGMNAETLSHIFEPFFTTKTGGKGTGLGLATTYGIVKQSGGYIWVYSEPGKGTTFKVYLPRVAAAADLPEEVRKKEVVPRGTETILLVEDNEAVRGLAETVLASYGYKVLVAQDPADAQKLAGAPGVEIHLVLTDVVMPTMSGRELVAQLNRKCPHLRVLYMSGYTDNVIASGGVLEAGLAFLQKPFTPALLAQKVRDVLDAKTPIAK